MRTVSVAIREGTNAARGEWDIQLQEWRARLDQIRKETEAILGDGPEINLDFLGGRGANGDAADNAGREIARKVFHGLSDEWERLRHEVALAGLDVLGTEPDRLALEMEHAKRMLDIQERRLHREREAGAIEEEAYEHGLRELQVRREIAEARQRELEAVHRANEAQRASLQRQDIQLEHRLAVERLLNQVQLDRLGHEGTIAERKSLQLDLVQRTYQLQREALENDLRLTNEARQVELERLDLARQREEQQIRLNAAVREELEAKRKQDQLTRSITGNLSSLLSGGLSGANIGSTLGTAVGSMMPVVGTVLGSTVGGMLGGIFDSQEEAASSIATPLRAIERAQRETIQAIETQTEQLLSPVSQAFNLPTTFQIPSYLPMMPAAVGQSGAVSNNTYVEDNTSLSVSVHVTGGISMTERELSRSVEDGVRKAVSHSHKNRVWRGRKL